jgi:hypothetical protein
MEAVSTTEKSVKFYKTTQRNIPQDSHLHLEGFHLKKMLKAENDVAKAWNTLPTTFCTFKASAVA